MTQKEKKQVENFAKKIKSNFVNNFDYTIGIDYNDIKLFFPNDGADGVEISIDMLQHYLRELDSIKFYDNGTKVTTDLITQRVIKINTNFNVCLAALRAAK